jgi:transposase-like protein
MQCPGCGGIDLIKRGRKGGHQRYQCRMCNRYSTDSQPRFTDDTRRKAIDMYMNSMGIRAIGRVLGASPAAVLKWIRKEHAAIRPVADTAPHTSTPDVIEMDEIYTYVQKKPGER